MSRTIMNLEESRELEARCAVRMGLDTLMRRAGTFAAKWLDERLPCPHVTVLAGPGNNGGDAIVCACELKRLGHTVQLVMPGGEPKTELAREMLADWIALGGTVISDPYMTEKADAVVDGLFGTGLKRPITGDYLDAILWFNERQCFRLALDVPSGLHSETGHWVGTMPGVTADATVTFLSAKSGLYMNEGVDAAGAVVVSELDVSVPLTRLGLIEYSDFDHICQPRPKFSHKGTFGHVAVVGGAEGHIGAALLSARAALRMGAGTVTVELLTPNAMMVDPVAPELMFSSTPLDFSRFTAAVIGPGLGQSAAAKARLEAALASNIPLVLDADALNLSAGDKAEGARLLKVTPQIIQSDRVNAVRDIALQTGAITVLKGPGTLIAMRSSRTWLSPYATASLATAGSGDVLSGMIASFLGQRYDTVESVLGAVMLHGYAGKERVAGLTASEIASIAVEPLETYRRTNARPYW